MYLVDGTCGVRAEYWLHNVKTKAEIGEYCRIEVAEIRTETE